MNFHHNIISNQVNTERDFGQFKVDGFPSVNEVDAHHCIMTHSQFSKSTVSLENTVWVNCFYMSECSTAINNATQRWCIKFSQ